jgi:hypothetical protein
MVPQQNTCQMMVGSLTRDYFKINLKPRHFSPNNDIACAQYDRPGLFYCCVICKCDRAPFKRLVHQRTITTTIALMLRARTTTTTNKYDVQTRQGHLAARDSRFFFLETSSVKKIKK